MSRNRKTGFHFIACIYSADGAPRVTTRESWHRTLAGAEKARTGAGGKGRIMRCLSTDHWEVVTE